MDPNLKFVLDEINKKFAEQDAKWEQRFANLELSRDERVVTLEQAALAFNSWKPSIEHAVDVLHNWKPDVDASIQHSVADLTDLRLKVRELSKHWERAVLERTAVEPPLLRRPVSASARVPGGLLHADGPMRHCDASHYRAPGFGSYTIPNPVPVKGTSFTVPYDSRACRSFDCSNLRTGVMDRVGRLPKLNFPQFDGMNLKLWISRSESYFDMYGVEQSLWIRVASMHFDGVAARWLQSVERELRFANWNQFCHLLLEHFGKDQHELLIRQFYNMGQTGSVSEYIQQFSELVDQLQAYESDTDKLHYATRFIDGLRDEIKAVLMMHRPSDLDTACSLALLQEEAAGSSRRKEFRKFSNGFQAKSGPNSLPSDASKTDRLHSDEKRRFDPSKRASEHDKLAALRAYRRAKGRDHKCSTTIQLHVLQEVYELFQLDSISEEDQEIPSEVEEQAFLALSEAAVSGSEPPKTLRLWGTIQSIAILILIDSASSSTFLSQKVADKLSGVSALATPLSVRVANGGSLSCCSEIKQAKWFIQSCQFQADLKIFTVGSL
ncbi:hypothetical protein U9M48_027287 [Paspalum notatum var. saurae]|uniref:Retrotransposon gag domain-containing protein n=1 Tax=Paspalum notatum var. saurae TaxID=547442 RepID=A0AAQ3TUK2_PASNO